jgi:hypothetical protein
MITLEDEHPASDRRYNFRRICPELAGAIDKRLSRRSMPPGLTRGWIRFADKDMRQLEHLRRFRSYWITE